MSLPGWRDWVFSLKTFAAAMLAVYIGLLTSLPRPYWAMATVYICSQPLSGATRSKGVYRVIGTLTGAIVAVMLVPNLANAPVLLTGALILWVGFCLYFSLQDRTPRSYAFMLGGYTAALIGFPAVNDPGSIFDLAVARSEEITLGIICATLISSVVLPRSVGEAIAARSGAWIGDGARLALDALAGKRSEQQTRRDLLRLAGDAAEIDMLSTHLSYDSSQQRTAADHVLALRLRMLMLLPVLSSIADRIGVLRATGQPLPPRLGAAFDLMRAWIRPGPPPSDLAEQQRDEADTERLRAAIDAAEPGLDPSSDWVAVLTASLTIRLRELVDLASDNRVLRRAIAGGRPLDAPLRVRPDSGVAVMRHRDRPMAVLSAVGVSLAMALCCAFWIGTGWPDGSAAPMMAAVACCFFATQDDPVPAIMQFANCTLVAVVVMAVYQFAIFPAVRDFEMVILVLAPLFLIVGVMIARPQTAGRGLAIAANGATVLALQSTYGADFPSYVNGNLALLLGMYAGAVVMRLVRSVGAEWAIRRILRAGNRAIGSAAARRRAEDRAGFAGLMLDQLGLIAPRVASLGPDHALRARDLLAPVRIGLNVIDLRRARHDLAHYPRRTVEDLLDAIAQRYRSGRGDPDARLLNRIDRALAAVLNDRSPGQHDALLGLVGIRRGLFPEAPPYQPEQPGGPLHLDKAAA